jgi:RNA polymerase sigma factor (sigma-70 family)
VQAVTPTSHRTALWQVQRLFATGTIGWLTDGQLLERLTSSDPETAGPVFEALLERHGPMVLRVCQSVLGQRHDAEDAFQATFLILARRAASIRTQNSVVSWLHGVALRVAKCQKGAAARRRRHEQKVAEQRPAFADSADRDERAALLHEELDRLPEKYRVPIVLCHLESLSHEQAARHLSWPIGTVRSRLARGREQLRDRLMRRGLAPSVFMLRRVLRSETAGAAITVSPELATLTVRAALHYASGKALATCGTSTSIAFLVEGALKGMILAKMKFALLACGLIAAGALAVAQQVGTGIPRNGTQAASAGASDERLGRFGTASDSAAIAQELSKIDLELLAEDVRELREQVKLTYKNKLRAERTKSEGAGAANRAFETARAAYLAKARELRKGQREFGNAKQPAEGGTDEMVTHTAPRDDRIIDESPTDPRPPRQAAAVIGSIDLDAVFQRYEKVQALNEELDNKQEARKNELRKLKWDAETEDRILAKLMPGSEQRKKHEVRVTDLMSQYETVRDQAEHELSQRRSEAAAAIYHEIQATVAALARAKGLTYVVKVSKGPRTDSESNNLSTALNASVVYADPRNDLTDEVVGELNRKFRATSR